MNLKFPRFSWKVGLDTEIWLNGESVLVASGTRASARVRLQAGNNLLAVRSSHTTWQWQAAVGLAADDTSFDLRYGLQPLAAEEGRAEAEYQPEPILLADGDLLYVFASNGTFRATGAQTVDVLVVGGGGGGGFYAGGGGGGGNSDANGRPGASGGGASARPTSGRIGGAASQGHGGGSSEVGREIATANWNGCYGGGGGGGAGAAGEDCYLFGDNNNLIHPGRGGDGVRCDFSGEEKWYGGGGGGGAQNWGGPLESVMTVGGKGGGGYGTGYFSGNNEGHKPGDGEPGTGGGGGGAGRCGGGRCSLGGTGGSGVVIIRYLRESTGLYLRFR